MSAYNDQHKKMVPGYFNPKSFLTTDPKYKIELKFN